MLIETGAGEMHLQTNENKDCSSPEKTRKKARKDPPAGPPSGMGGQGPSFSPDPWSPDPEGVHFCSKPPHLPYLVIAAPGSRDTKLSCVWSV